MFMKIFLNLLPPERKEGLIRNYYWQFFLGKWFLVFLFILMLLATMAFMYGKVYLQQKALIALSTETKSEHQKQYADFEKKFEETNSQVRSANGFLTLHTSFSKVLAEIESILPSGVLLEKISTQEYKIFLTGTADTRETFLIMQENIKKNSCFESLNTPLSNLFSETNVQFQLDFSVKQECLRGILSKT